MHSAAAGGYVEVMQWLMEQGADIHARDSDGLEPIHYAASGGHVEAMKWLKARGANINARTGTSHQQGTFNGRSTMHYAAVAGHIEAMAWLKEQGVDVNVRNAVGQTSLDIVRFGGHNKEKAIQWLEANGAVSGASLPAQSATNSPSASVVAQPNSLPQAKAVSWFVVRGGQAVGPFALNALQTEIANGQMTRETPVWREGMHE